MCRPAARSARPKPTVSWSSRRPSISGPQGACTTAGSTGSGIVPVRLLSAAGGDLGQHPPGLLAPELADVLLVLEHDPEGLVDDLGRQLAGTQTEQRRRPVERL